MRKFQLFREWKKWKHLWNRKHPGTLMRMSITLWKSIRPNGIRQWNWEILSGSSSTTTAQGGRSLPNTSHRSGLEKENVPYTGTPRAIWKHLHGRTSSIKKTVGIMNFSKSCACAGNRRKQAHFQALRQK